MKALQRLSAISLLVLVTSACVTIHIYFPAAAAEEAARVIVRDVLDLQDSAPVITDPADGPTSRSPSPAASLMMLAWVLDRVVPPAVAQTPDLRVETPATSRLQAAMRARNSELSPYLRSGAVGFGRDGFVAIRDLSEVPLRDRSQVQRLVREENADRSALYKEIARANDRPDWESNIQQTFARVWVDEAPSGYWYQDSSGNWRQK